MRIAGLLLFILFFPAFAHAALININTADSVTLQTLPGIGTVIAGRIIDYRTTNGPFARIEGIQKVRGIGNGVTYANIAPLITVGDTSASNTTDSSTTASSTPSTAAPSGSVSTYTPPPSVLMLDVEASQNAVVEVPLHLTARAMTKGNVTDLAARIVWGFGDGSGTEGTIVEKIYRYAGTYLITVTATNGTATAHDEFIVTVRPAQVRILEVSGSGITIANDASERLDLSAWTLSADFGSFRIPSGTVILPKANVLFPATITHLPTTPDVTLRYPNGVSAARYSPTVSAAQTDIPLSSTIVPAVQPSTPVTSYESVQTEMPSLISTKANIQTHEEAVVAPTASTKLAAVGAALPSPLLAGAESAPPVDTRTSGLFRSPWFLGLLGVIALAGSAFIFF